MYHHWFSLQYGNDEESYQQLLYHPIKQRSDKFFNHFDEAVLKAAHKIIKDENLRPVTDFLLTNEALKQMNTFKYITITPKYRASFQDLILWKPYHPDKKLMTLHTSSLNKGINHLLSIDFFNGRNFSSINYQLYDIVSSDISIIKKTLKQTLDDVNATKVYKSCLTIDLVIKQKLKALNSLAIPLYDVFIPCKHKISAKYYQNFRDRISR